ncbi:hypothetical protein [Phytoactinopolyspora endophytica]|uniref:hypothetical protein n=1 Tax=Phytoactinopolyspora endophytica TaxID=1642495 RepID=UPI00101B9853|nr:hypothetical protein [Phytoactinopolyspora endophytica]
MNHAPLHIVLGAGPAGSILGTHLARTGARVRNVSSSTADRGPAVESVAADLSTPVAAIAATEGAWSREALTERAVS